MLPSPTKATSILPERTDTPAKTGGHGRLIGGLVAGVLLVAGVVTIAIVLTNSSEKGDRSDSPGVAGDGSFSAGVG